MKKIFLFLMLLAYSAGNMLAQETITVTGTVVDEHSEPLVGVTVAVKDSPGFGTITDIDGNYKITVSSYSVLIFTYLSYESQEIPVKGRPTVNVKLKEAKSTELDEVVVTGLGARKKITVTGAISTVDPKDLKTPTASIANALAGNVPGILARQTSGQPGKNISEFWIRGISTFGAGSSALVLVDGFERSLDEINAEDIENFSVLKDASATAIYGSRGANGVVLITTRHGQAGKVNINAKGEWSWNTSTIRPKTVDGVTYATMLNQALLSRNQEPAYSASDIELIGNGLDPDLFPNINWMDMLMKDGAPTYRANVDVSGGGSTARYFISGSYVEEGGMYRVDKDMKKDYNTNANYRRWNYRMNTDVNITKTTLLALGVSGSLEKQNEPGGRYDEIWGSLLGQTPVRIPVKYSNGYIASRGGGERNNPWVLITQQGYTETWKNKVQITGTLDQNLDFVTKGLRFLMRFGFDTNNYNYNRRMKWPTGWQAENMRNGEGELEFKKVIDEQLMTIVPTANGNRRENFEAELHYDRNFGDHTVGATFKYMADRTVNTSENKNADYIQSIDFRHQGLVGRLTYGWRMRYFLDFNFGYTGSENFATGHQYGFFPAVSGAWNIAEEPIVKKLLPWMGMFKVRYSYGKVGNDNLGKDYTDNANRFPYRSTFKNLSYAYQYADITGSRTYNGLTYAKIASPYVTWEVAKKHDVGVDFSLFSDHFSGSIDYFNEKRTGIYTSRSYLPAMVGLNTLNEFPRANVGGVKSEGIDGNIAFRQKIGQVDVTARANMTYSKNRILDYDESYSRYPYLLQTGFRVDQDRGLIAEGLFVDYEDIRNHALQVWGDVAPGDIKYKDINGDGVVNNDDRTAIGATTRPNLIYGFGISAAWKNFDVNVHFQGSGKSTFQMNGFLIQPFRENDWGNILTDVVGKYWQEGINEDPHATYPRLTYGYNGNNYQPSTYWQRNGSYLRLKNLEIGYTLPKRWVNPLRINHVRVYFMGTNLLTFSDFDLWDPEMGSTTGKEYPISRTYTVGLTVSL